MYYVNKFVNMKPHVVKSSLKLIITLITVYDKNFTGENFHQRLVLCIGTKISPNLISPTVRALGRK